MTKKKNSSKTTRGKVSVKVTSERTIPAPVEAKRWPIIRDWKDDVIQYYRSECSTAWKCFLAASFERYMFAMELYEKERHLAVGQDMALIFQQPFLSEEERELLLMEMDREIRSHTANVEKDMHSAGKRYVKALNDFIAGRPIKSLSSIDPDVGCDYFMDLVKEGTITPTPPLAVSEEDKLNLSFTSSIASEESGFATARSTLEESTARDLLRHSVPATDTHSDGEIEDPGVKEIQPGVKEIQPGVKEIQPGVKKIQPGVKERFLGASGASSAKDSESSSVSTVDSRTQLGAAQQQMGSQKNRKKKKKGGTTNKSAASDMEVSLPEGKFKEMESSGNINLSLTCGEEQMGTMDDEKGGVVYPDQQDGEKMKLPLRVEEKVKLPPRVEVKPPSFVEEKVKLPSCAKEKVKLPPKVEEKVKSPSCVEENVKVPPKIVREAKPPLCVDEKVKPPPRVQEEAKPPQRMEEKVKLLSCVDEKVEPPICVERKVKPSSTAEEKGKPSPQDKEMQPVVLDERKLELATCGTRNGLQSIRPIQVSGNPPLADTKCKPSQLEHAKMQPLCLSAEHNGRAEIEGEMRSLKEEKGREEQNKEKSSPVVASSSGDSSTAGNMYFQHDVNKQIEDDERLARQLSRFWEYADSDKEQGDRPMITTIQSKVEPKPAVNGAVSRSSSTTGDDNSHTKNHNGQHLTYNTREPARKFSRQSALNKTSLCWTYNEKGTCPWGNECIFAHGRSELRPFPEWFTANGSHRPGFIPSKPKAVPGHSEPCDDQLCIARLHFYLRKTTICKQWQAGRCKYDSKDCKFAHGVKDRRPLPKHEMCEKHMRGKCRVASSECVYAHSLDEYRPISKKAVGKSAAVLPWKPPAANSNAADGELDNCIICYEEFTAPWDRCRLDCGHDGFHRRCIQQWIGREKSCPFCREYIDTVDGFVTQRGAKSKGYPPLSSR